jgi:hypothetical protein
LPPGFANRNNKSLIASQTPAGGADSRQPAELPTVNRNFTDETSSHAESNVNNFGYLTREIFCLFRLVKV